MKNLTLLIMCTLFITNSAYADEWFISMGGGDQLHEENQSNHSIGIDYSFAKWKRSYRQFMYFGVSATAMQSDTDDYDEMYALSIYPQLTLFAEQQSYGHPFFFVRALGPSYLSENRLGKRQQAYHFAFQAQVGVGLYIPLDEKQNLLASISFKHFSNANIFSENDGIDLPVMLNIGLAY